MPYICVNKAPIIEKSIMSLVEKLKAEYGIRAILVFGASGGGAAGIYYGFTYNFYMCLLSPVYDPGSALYHNYNNYFDESTSLRILEKTAGSCGEESQSYLDELVRNSVLKNVHRFSKRIFITCGSLEPFYSDCSLALKNDCEANGLKLEFQTAEIREHIFAVDYFLDAAVSKVYEFFFGYTDNSRYAAHTDALNRITLDLFKERSNIIQMLAETTSPPANEVNFSISSPFVVPLQAIGNEADLLRHNTFLADPAGVKSLAFDTVEEYWNIVAPTDWFRMQRLELRPVSILCAAFRASGDTEFLVKAAEIIEFGLRKLFVLQDDTFLNQMESSEVRVLRIAECMAICFEAGFQITGIEAIKRFLSNGIPQRESVWSNVLVKKLNEQMLFTYAALHKNHNRVGRQCAAAALKSLLARISIYFPSHGLAVTGGVEGSINEYQACLAPILHYYRGNDLPEDLPEWREFCRKTDEIRLAAEHLVLPDGLNLPIGNTGACKRTYCRYIPHSFLPKNHSFKLLKSETAVVSVNGLYEMIPAEKHDDELSFTFMYDGIQVVYDSGGRPSDPETGQYLRSARAHSGLFADDDKYFCDLFDFVSAVEKFDEYTVVHSVNDGYDNVTLKRTLVWLKDNAIILLDSGKSKDGKPHTFTQNFIFANFEAVGDSDAWGFEAVLSEGNEMRLKLCQYGDLPEKVSVFSGTDSPDGCVYFSQNERLQRQRFAYEITAQEAEYATVLMVNAAKARGEYSEVTVAKIDGRYAVTAVSENKELRFMVNEAAPDTISDDAARVSQGYTAEKTKPLGLVRKWLASLKKLSLRN
jgi:hypothetical protein